MQKQQFCYCLKIKSFITVIITNLPHQHGKRYHLLQEGIIIIEGFGDQKKTKNLFVFTSLEMFLTDSL